MLSARRSMSHERPSTSIEDIPAAAGAMGLTVVEHGNDEILIRVSGDLDIASGPVLEEVIGDLTSDDRQVALDLSAVEFADAAGFHVLLCACVLPGNDARVHIVESSDAIRRLVALALEAAADVP